MPRKGRRFERQGYDFMRTKNITTTTAPFATNHTPQIGIKIIGSKRVPWIENLAPPEQSPASYGPRVPPLQNIAENPTKIDPRVYAEETKGYFNSQRAGENIEYGEDNFSPNVHGNPTFANRSRPDSKTLSPYNSLPPIRANRSKNQMSTVFEQEPWIKRGESPKLSKETEYNKVYNDEHQRPFSDRPMNGYHSENNFKLNFQSKEHFEPPKKAQSDSGMNYGRSSEREELIWHYLPPKFYGNDKLPSDPILLTRDARDDNILMNLIGNELKDIDVERMYQVYITAVTNDKDNSGLCSFMRLKNLLESHMVAPHPDTLRLVAAMHVDPHRQGQVYYQRILEYLDKALKYTHPELYSKRHDGYGNSSNSYSQHQQRNSPIQGLDPYREKDTAKILALVRDTLNYSGYGLDLEGLSRDFQTMDPLYRGTLSKAQISDVVYRHKIPLQDSVLNRILDKYQQPNGQYKWDQVLRFFEQVQSLNTGYPMPQSKRPLEHARQYPTPHENWPYPQESPRYSPEPTYRNGSYSYRDEPPQSERERRILEKLRKTEEEINQLKNRNKEFRTQQQYDYEPESDTDRRLREKINQIEEEILELKYKNQEESGHQNGVGKENREKHILDQIKRTQDEIDYLKMTGKTMRDGGKEYNRSDKLLKLSGILYAIDEHSYKSSGFLPYNILVQKTLEFNDYENMRIPEDLIRRLAQEYKNAKDHVDIYKFVDHLGTADRWYDRG